MNSEFPNISILLVEDNPGDAYLIQELLVNNYGDKFVFQTAETLAEAQACLSAGDFHVILLDLSLPDSRGVETVIQTRKFAPLLPIVVLTGLEDNTLIHQILELGAQDYLIKGKIDPSTLSRSLRYAIERMSYQQEIESISRFPSENPHPILRLSHNGILLYANSSSALILAEWGWQVGHPLSPDWIDRLNRSIGSGERINLDLPCGERFYAFTIVPFSSLGYANLYAYDITERIHLEQQTRESETRYHTLFENMLDGFAYCRMLYQDGEPIEFIYLEVNRQFAALTGLTDVIGKPVSQVIPGIRQTNPELFEAYSRVALTGIPEKLETYVPTLAIWFSISVYSPAKEYFVAVFQNITARKQAEAGLVATHARLKYFVDANIIGVVIADKFGGLIEVNDYYLKLIGYTRQDFDAGLVDWKSITPPEHLHADDLAIHELEQFGYCTPYEKEYIRKDGSRVWVFLSDALMPDGLIAAYALDITARKHAEAALVESEDKFKYVFDHSIVPMSLTHPSGQLRVNQAFCDLLGYTQAELENLSWSDITHPADLLRTQEVVDGLISGSITSSRLNKRYLHKNGSIIWCDASTSLRRSADGSPEYFVTLIIDITERKAAEEILQQYSHRLEQEVAQRTNQLLLTQKLLVQQERLAALGQIAGGVSHELRNPIGVISNAVYFLKLIQPDAPDKVKEYLDILENQVHISKKIVAELLDFTRTTISSREKIDLGHLLHQVLQTNPLPSGVILALDMPPALPPLFVDPAQIQQVLNNLILNAYQAMPDGGLLELCAFQNNSSNPPTLSLQVIDAGSGITPENLSKIFTPLFTTKPRGIGLGLAISKKWAESNGGSLTVDSPPGRGAIFTLTLPINPY